MMGFLLRSLAVVFITFPLSSCISTISSYDEQTDAAATQLQKDIDTFLVKMSSSPSRSDRYFSANQHFYQKAAVDLDSLEIRTESINANSLTVEQVKLIKDNFAYMTLLHKGCVTAPLTDAQKHTVQTNGIDVSVSCRVEYGATVEAADRGSSAFNPVFVGPIKSLFDIEFGAILKLELEKKKLGGGAS
jgi:UDP-galactopyranose mutase